MTRRAHLFATPDGSVPDRRSRQLLDALRDAGWQASASLPRQPGSAPGAALHDAATQIDLVRQHCPDVLIWTDPAARAVPWAAGAVQVVDVSAAANLEAGPHTRLAARARIVQACRGADLVLLESPAAHGFWSAEFSRAGVPHQAAVVPPSSLPNPGAEPTTLTALRAVLSRETDLHALAEAAQWAERRGGLVLHILQQGPGDPAILQALAMLDRLGCVQVRQDGGGALLDLRRNTEEARIAAPYAVIDALASGRPVLSLVTGPLGQHLSELGAGCVTDAGGLVPALDQLAASFGGMAAAAPLAVAGFSSGRSAHALLSALDDALARAARRTASRTRPSRQAGGHVLVLSDEARNLQDIRIHLPFGALHRRGAIGGYTVMHRDGTAFSTRPPGKDPAFDAIWLHRSVSTDVQWAMRQLALPYVYDLDDNLLASPAYREAFRQRHMDVARSLIEGCTALSCSTARLAALVGQEVGGGVAGRAVVTANLGAGHPVPRQPGPARAVVWSSSDVPALTASRAAVQRAVRDFCLARRLPLVCVGVRAPGLLSNSGMQVEHVGLLPYGAYLEYLRSLSPAILVCPLETSGDPETQRFVDGKSDVKVIEALLTGLVGVFSDAAPYRESTLPTPILCGNTESEWLDGLERAYQACAAPSDPAPWPDQRAVDGEGLLPWMAALDRVRLPAPVHLSAVTEALSYAQERRGLVRLEAHEFDEEHYLRTHEDVRTAVAHGRLGSGFQHYAEAGFAERRDARALPSAGPDAREWWGGVLHAMQLLEHQVRDGEAALEAAQARISLRHALRRPAP